MRSYQQCVEHLCWRLHPLIPDPLAVTMPSLSERHSNDDRDNNTSPQIEWVCFVAMFSGILLHSPSALVSGWDRVQNAEAFSLFPFLDAYFSKCHVHLLGQLYEGFFSFPPTLHVGHRLPRHMHTLWGLAPIGWSWNFSAGNEGCAFSDRAPQPSPFRCKRLLASWKEGLAQVVSSCSLHTWVPVSPRLESGFLSLFDFWNPPSGQLLNASIVQTCCQNPGGCAQGPERCP